MNLTHLLAFGSTFLFLEFHVYEVIKRISSRSCDVENYEKNQVDKREFTIGKHAVMDVEKGHGHCRYHRDDCDPDKQASDEENGAGKLTENTEHQCHITTKAEYARIGIRQFIEVHHLVQSMRKEEDAEEQSECKDEQRYYPVPAILGE